MPPADGGGLAQVHLVVPRGFNDAKQIADRFKRSVPVIVNLQDADVELSKRLIDFASGLTYALNGSMQRIADKVFLLTPPNIEVSAEERAKALERGGFYNQAYGRNLHDFPSARECSPRAVVSRSRTCRERRRDRRRHAQ